MRKRILIVLFGNLLGAVTLVLVLAWAVGAQGPEPGERELYRSPHPAHPTGVRLDEKPAPRPAAPGVGAAGVLIARTFYVLCKGVHIAPTIPASRGSPRDVVSAVLPTVWPGAHGSAVGCSDVAHAPTAPSAHPIPACGTLPVAQM